MAGIVAKQKWADLATRPFKNSSALNQLREALTRLRGGRAFARPFGSSGLTMLNLSRPIAVRDQAAGADDLDCAVSEHLDGIAPLTRFVGEHRDHGSLDVIAVGLVDPVADFKF